MADRVTELRVEGLRTLEKLHLPLDGLTVLIGENGSGKSSIIEACQLLRAVARPEFNSAFHGVQGGMFSLLRWGATRLTLGAHIGSDSGDPPLDYEIVLLDQGGHAAIHGESLRVGGGVLMERVGPGEVRVGDDLRSSLRVAVSESALGWTGIGVDPQILRARTALDQIEAHVAFETMPLSGLRAPVVAGQRFGLRCRFSGQIAWTSSATTCPTPTLRWPTTMA